MLNALFRISLPIITISTFLNQITTSSQPSFPSFNPKPSIFEIPFRDNPLITRAQFPGTCIKTNTYNIRDFRRMTRHLNLLSNACTFRRSILNLILLINPLKHALKSTLPNSPNLPLTPSQSTGRRSRTNLYSAPPSFPKRLALSGL